jgi:hypothetical protein
VHLCMCSRNVPIGLEGIRKGPSLRVHIQRMLKIKGSKVESRTSGEQIRVSSRLASPGDGMWATRAMGIQRGWIELLREVGVGCHQSMFKG